MNPLVGPGTAVEPALFAGLMSGTSLDGVDGVLVRFGAAAAAGNLCDQTSGQRPLLQVLAHAHAAFDDTLRADLLALNTPGENELHLAALAANRLAEVQAAVLADLLRLAGVPASAVAAVGSHGQTVRHRPGEFDGLGYTCQLNQPARLAELCGIPVVADFRSRDVAAGGQGAPLVPAFHARVFGLPDRPRAVLNLGGIANLTLLPAGAQAGDGAGVTGFDCGPGNALLDHWTQTHLRQPFDADGAWAAQGRVSPPLLKQLLEEPFLQRLPPKSTGRDLFHPGWLAQQLARAPGVVPTDVQATLTEFSVQAAAQALRRHAPQVRELLVCGGGALNAELMRRLAAALPEVAVRSSAEAGLPPLQVEAAAFAWLACACLAGAPGNLPAVTGAAGLRVLGAVYPA